jgi:hypothetical protein
VGQYENHVAQGFGIVLANDPDEPMQAGVRRRSDGRSECLIELYSGNALLGILTSGRAYHFRLHSTLK